MRGRNPLPESLEIRSGKPVGQEVLERGCPRYLRMDLQGTLVIAASNISGFGGVVMLSGWNAS